MKKMKRAGKKTAKGGKVLVVNAELPEILKRHEPLRPELKKYVVEEPTLGLRFRHQTLQMPIFSLDRCAHIHLAWDAKQKTLADLIKKRKYREFVMEHDRPYRMRVLAEHQAKMSDRVFWKTFGEVWTMSENLSEDNRLIRKLLASPRSHRSQMMPAADRKALRSMPEVLTIFRGYSAIWTWEGYSWTIDKEKAVWFAKRCGLMSGKPRVAEATVEKRDVVAYFTDREESEIVVDYRAVTLLRTFKVPKAKET